MGLSMPPCVRADPSQAGLRPSGIDHGTSSARDVDSALLLGRRRAQETPRLAPTPTYPPLRVRRRRRNRVVTRLEWCFRDLPFFIDFSVVRLIAQSFSQLSCWLLRGRRRGCRTPLGMPPAASRCGRRPPPWVGRGKLHVAALALPTSRPDVRSAVVGLHCVPSACRCSAFRHSFVPGLVSAHLEDGCPLSRCALVSRSGCCFRFATRSPPRCV